MASKVKMLEDKLSGSTQDEHAVHDVATVPTAVALAAPMATPYDPAPIPCKQPTPADRPPTAGTGANYDNETSFTNNRPSTSSSSHDARPKTSKTGDEDERPDTRRPSMAMPYIAE